MCHTVHMYPCPTTSSFPVVPVTTLVPLSVASHERAPDQQSLSASSGVCQSDKQPSPGPALNQDSFHPIILSLSSTPAQGTTLNPAYIENPQILYPGVKLEQTTGSNQVQSSAQPICNAQVGVPVANPIQTIGVVQPIQISSTPVHCLYPVVWQTGVPSLSLSKTEASQHKNEMLITDVRSFKDDQISQIKVENGLEQPLNLKDCKEDAKKCKALETQTSTELSIQGCNLPDSTSFSSVSPTSEHNSTLPSLKETVGASCDSSVGPESSVKSEHGHVPAAGISTSIQSCDPPSGDKHTVHNNLTQVISVTELANVASQWNILNISGTNSALPIIPISYSNANQLSSCSTVSESQIPIGPVKQDNQEDSDAYMRKCDACTSTDDLDNLENEDSITREKCFLQAGDMYTAPMTIIDSIEVEYPAITGGEKSELLKLRMWRKTKKDRVPHEKSETFKSAPCAVSTTSLLRKIRIFRRHSVASPSLSSSQITSPPAASPPVTPSPRQSWYNKQRLLMKENNIKRCTVVIRRLAQSEITAYCTPQRKQVACKQVKYGCEENLEDQHSPPVICSYCHRHFNEVASFRNHCKAEHPGCFAKFIKYRNN